jgi:hypothetical protein
MKPVEWAVVDAPRKPQRLHVVGGPKKRTRGPLRPPVGDEHRLQRCEPCLRSLGA